MTPAQLIAGRLVPDARSVTKGLVRALCVQDATGESQAFPGFVLDWSPSAQKVRRILAMEDGWLWRYDTLSSGHRSVSRLLQYPMCRSWLSRQTISICMPWKHSSITGRFC